MLGKLLLSLESLLFTRRWLVLALFAWLTAMMGYFATQLKVDAGFTKLLPMQHEYMQTFSQHQQEFGGANRVVIALVDKRGDMFNPAFFQKLSRVTDEVFFIPGVDRARVQSLFTPNVRFTEVVEGGITGGNVIPADFRPDAQGLAQVRENILKAGIVGRLVANDFSGALISAQLQEINPESGEQLDYIAVAAQLEQIRQQFADEQLDIHIIGFAKAVGDIVEGAERVVLFFVITLLITLLLSWGYTGSWVMSGGLIGCALAAVVWQLGLLPLFGYGLDPMSVLIPFLVFAIAVSHGVQMVSCHCNQLLAGGSAEQSARQSFRRLLLPCSIALLSDTLGFITIYLIDIRVIQEMAVTASLGVAVIILLNLFLLPVLLSFVVVTEAKQQALLRRRNRLQHFWAQVATVATRPRALMIVLGALMLAGVGGWLAQQVQIGDLQRGVPELRADARYNQDTTLISQRFTIGVDVLNVIVEAPPESCVHYALMQAIDDFSWAMRNVAGVQSVIAMPMLVKTINAGWNEGNPKWQVLPRDASSMAQSVAYIPSSSGLLNADCSVMPVMIFTKDHKAATINRVVQAVKDYRTTHPHPELRFRLATGNVGVMAASNEEIAAAQFPILLYLFSAIITLCLLTFRSLHGTLYIMLPLGLVSLLAYALMAQLDIGLKVATLPVVALGVGVGVDYGIYIYSRLREHLQRQALYPAYCQTLQEVGGGVLFTALTLALGVACWIFSPLKFQADMGILLTFMFLVNMVAAVVLLPALACVMGGRKV